MELKVKNTQGETQSCTLYSTKEEAGSPALSVPVNGVPHYAVLGTTDSAEATGLRVKNTEGKVFAVLKGVEAVNGNTQIRKKGIFKVPSGVRAVRLMFRGASRPTWTKYVGVEARKEYSVSVRLWFYDLAQEVSGVEVVFGKYQFREIHGGDPVGVPIEKGNLVRILWSKEVNNHTLDGIA